MSALVSHFARLHQRQPDRALIHLPGDGTSITAAHVWHAHLLYAEALRANGIRPGQLIVAAIGNQPAAVPLLLGARAAGVALAAVDAGTTAAELDAIAEESGAAAFVVRSSSAPRGGRPFLGGLTLVEHTGAVRTDYHDTAILKMTSGSTGLPKAARTNDAQLIADSEQIVAGMGIGPDDTQLAVIPLSHAYGISVILVPLILQGTAMVLRESFVPQLLPADAAAFHATTFAGVPYMFEYFAAHRPPGGWPAALRRLISAGALLPAATTVAFLDAFDVKIHSFYGASEAGGISFDAGDGAEGAETVGTPLPGVTITLRDDDHAPAGSGRVHVRSAGVAGGYVGQLSEDFCDGGFLTGDYGIFDAHGRLRLTGRVSSFINVAGKKVPPAEVEQVLRQMPGVRDVRVLAAPDAQRGEQVVACLAVDPACTVTTLTVRRFCSSRLAPHKIPRAVVVLEAIPLTARGKADRRALHELIRARIAGFTEQMC